MRAFLALLPLAGLALANLAQDTNTGDDSVGVEGVDAAAQDVAVIKAEDEEDEKVEKEEPADSDKKAGDDTEDKTKGGDKCNCSIQSPICIQTVEGACRCMYAWKLACHKENPKKCPKPEECEADKCKCPLDKCKDKKGKEKCKCEHALKAQCAKEQPVCQTPEDKCDDDDSDDDTESDGEGKCACPIACDQIDKFEQCKCKFETELKCHKKNPTCVKPKFECKRDDDSETETETEPESDDDDGTCNCPRPKDCDDIRDPVKRCHCFNRKRAAWWHKKGACGQPPIENCDRYEPGECPDQEVNCRSIRDPYLRCKCRNQKRREWWASNGGCRPPMFERCEKFDDREDSCSCGPSNCPESGPWSCFCKAHHAFECWYKKGMKCRRPVVDVCSWDPIDRDHTNECECEPSNCPKFGPHKCFCESMHKIKCWEKCGKKCRKPDVSFCSYDPPSDKGVYEQPPKKGSYLPVIPGKKLVCRKFEKKPIVRPVVPCVKCQEPEKDDGKDCEKGGWCRECEKDGWCHVCRDNKCRPPKYEDEKPDRECRDGRCRECFGGWCKKCSRGVCKVCNRDGECKVCRDGWCKPIHRPRPDDSEDESEPETDPESDPESEPESDPETPPITPYKKCGGKTVNGTIECDKGFKCISDPFASCGLEADCFGICIPDKVAVCGGLIGKQCPAKFKCVPDTRDHDNCEYGKDPDCQGICIHEARYKN